MGGLGSRYVSGILATLCASGSTALDTQTITCGRTGTAINADRTVGFISGSIGTLVDGTSNLYAGAAIIQLYWDEPTATVVLKITGTLANSGWASMTRIGSGSVYTRASASFLQSGGFTSWTWTALSTFAMGAEGAVSTVVFQ
jgi:hypothetical protein